MSNNELESLNTNGRGVMTRIEDRSPDDVLRSTGWSDCVVPGQVNGHPSLVYADGVRSVAAVVEASLRWSDREYVVHGDRRITFGQHQQAVHAVAERLSQAGVSEGDRVGLFAANSAEWVVVFFAVLQLGAVAVPCNGWWSGEEMAHACQTVQPALVVTDERRASRVPDALTALRLDELVPDAVWTAPMLGSPRTGSGDEDAPAVVLFTAGTTGFPKGAVLSHRALIANLQTLLVVSRKLPWQISDDNPASVTLVGLPLFHMGAIQLILVPLMTGSRVVFLPGRFDPEEVLRLIEQEQVTMFSGVPTMMERLIRHPDARERDYSSLRTVVLGGSPVSTELLERVSAKFPNTRRRIGQTYGLTEAGGVVSTGVGVQMAEHPGSSGRLAPVVEVTIEAPDAEGNGEVLVRSPACMDGYWGLPDDPTLTSDGWIRTGDVGRVDADRFLYITGRRKDIIIRGGENVAAARVETVLQEHPAVAEVAVVGLPDPDLGETVAAAVVLSGAGTVTAVELEEWARRSLAHFAVPARWWLRIEPLPVNDAGKILKNQLVAQWPGDR